MEWAKKKEINKRDLFEQGLANYGPKVNPAYHLWAKHGFYRWTFAIDLMIGNTDVEFPFKESYSPPSKSSILLFGRLYYTPQKFDLIIIFDHYISHFDNKKQIWKFFSSLSIYRISLILPLGLKNLKYLLFPFQVKFAGLREWK